MRSGWPCKAGAKVLGIQTTKFSVAADKTFEKFAKLLMADPVATLRDLMVWVEHLQREKDELEIERRADMNNGRLDRNLLHASTPTRT